MSRARANFTFNENGVDGGVEMARSLKSMILSLQIMDKKYRETLPDLIRSVPTDTLVEGDSTAPLGIEKRSRKAKNKVGKDGLLSGEEVYAAKWWMLQIDECSGLEDRVQASLLEQRTRETKIQIILLLEILALEMAGNMQKLKQQTTDDHLPKAESTSTRRRGKKPLNFGVLLDLLADRLCIWQSMSSSPSRSSAKQSKHSRTNESHLASHFPTSDHLRQFCADVILPL